MRKLLVLLTPVLVLSLIVSTIGCAQNEPTTAATPQGTPSSTPKSTPAANSQATPTSTPQATAPAAPQATPTASGLATPTPTPRATAQATPTPAPKPIVLKVTLSYPETHPTGLQLKKFKELVEKYTDGRVKLDLYMGGVLFTAAAEWEAVRTGAVDISYTPPYYGRTVIPQYMVWHLKNLWEGYDHGWAVLQDGRVSQILRDLAREKGIEQIGLMPTTAYTTVHSRKKEISSFSDMASLKYGVTGAPPPLMTEYAKTVPIVISSADIYMALAQGIIDLYTAEPSSSVARKLWEVGPHVFVYQMSYFVIALWMNRDSWNRLPADLQDIIVKKAVPEVQQFAQENATSNDAKALETIRANAKSLHFATKDDTNAAMEFLGTEPKSVKEADSVGPELIDIVDSLRPSKKGK